MLQVTNGVVTITVTKGAFKSFYENNGFHVVNGENGHEDVEGVFTYSDYETGHCEDSSQQKMWQNTDDSEDDEDGDDEDVIDLSEIPLGEMSFDQLNEYADQLELDHEGIRSKKELRAIIRGYLKR